MYSQYTQWPTYLPPRHAALYNTLTLHQYINQYMDSGVSHHLITNSSHLANPSPYSEHEEVTLSNGNNVFISHIGHGSVNNDILVFKINTFLYVPQLVKN